MAEYIERETAIKALKDNVIEMECYIYYGSNLGVPDDEIEDILNEIPTADVKPVKHGQWIYMGDCGVTKCPCCGWTIEEYIEDKYCRECGVKMDGDKFD